MKFNLIKEIFEDRLSLSSRFTSSRVSAVQSIQGTHLLVKKDSIEITTTNLSDFFHTHISADVEEEGVVVFDSKKALEFLNFLKEGEISVSLDKNTLVIEQGKTKGHFNTYPAEDFPDLPALDGKTYPLKQELLDTLSCVLFSASKDETRPVMTGVYITHEGGKSFFVTTDGFRLSLLETDTEDVFPQVILPASIFHEVIRKSKDGTVTMTLSPEDRLVRFTIGEINIYSRVIEGEFPPYEKVIPKSSSTTVKVDKQELIKNIRLVSVFARDKADVIILDISKDGVYIKPKDSSEVDSQVFQELDSIEGEDIKIAFNYKYVLEFLNTIPGEVVTFECSQPAAPGVFSSEDLPGYIHIIMPLRTEETTG